MDHGGMHHGDGGHSGHDMNDMCQMSMLFTWSTKNLCIIFESWHIRTTPQLIFSLLAIVALTAGYELVREASRRYESATGGMRLEEPEDVRDLNGEEARSHVFDAGRHVIGKTITGRRQSKTVKGLLYAVQVFYSFFIMLLFMSYNGFVMLAVGVGAFVGYMLFANSSSTRSVACH